MKSCDPIKFTIIMKCRAQTTKKNRTNNDDNGKKTI